jgi:hypothetical protein
LFPNPATDQLNITTKNECELVDARIVDLTGRTLFHQTVKSTEFIAKLNIELMNGAYFITLTNSVNEVLTRKLLIAK